MFEAEVDQSVYQARDGLLVADDFSGGVFLLEHRLGDLGEAIYQACFEVLLEGRQDGFLGWEIEIDGPGRHPSCGCDGLNRGGLESPVPKQLGRSLEYLAPALVCRLHDPASAGLVEGLPAPGPG